MNKKLLIKFMLLIMSSVVLVMTGTSGAVLAMTEADHNAITNNVPFYDDNVCGDSQSTTGAGIEELRFPDCITDMTKCAQAIDGYIKDYSSSSPMNGLGNYICELGKQYDINPAWAVAQAQKETSLGTAGVGESCNNAYGIKQHDDWPSCSTGFSGYPDFEASVKDWYELVTGPIYLGNPDVKTLEDLISIYCPEDDGCDPEGYTKQLLDMIDTIMEKICGNSWASSASSSSDTDDSSGTGGSDTGDSSGDGTDSGLVEGVDTITDKDGEKHVIPAKSGKYGYEQHLGIVGYDDANNAEKHYEITNVPPGPMRNGMAGGNGALPTRDKNEEIYYIAMRWKYEGGGTGNEDPSWYQNTHPRVVVTYKKGDTVKQVIAAAVDWGPAESTGRVAGLSPEANKVIHPAVQDDGLETYQWAKDQSLEPGPVDGSDASGISSGNTCPDNLVTEPKVPPECKNNRDDTAGRNNNSTPDENDSEENNGTDADINSTSTTEEECIDEDGTTKECKPGDENCVKCEGNQCIECEPGEANCVKCEEGTCIICTNDKCFECTSEGECTLCTSDKCENPPPVICKKGEKLSKDGTECIECEKNENCPGTQPPPKPKPDSDCEIGVGKGGFVFPLCTTKKELKDTLKKHPGTSQIPCNSGYCHHDYPAGDLGDPVGTQVIAAEGGKVVGAEDYGKCDGGYDVPRVRIHGKDGHWYYYTHMKPGSVSKNKIKVGKRVDKAQQLGEIGPSSCAQGTPPHLHFDMSNVDNSFARTSDDNYAAARKYLINPWSWLNSSYEDLPAK